MSSLPNALSSPNTLLIHHILSRVIPPHPSLPHLTHQMSTADISNASPPSMNPSRTISAYQPLDSDTESGNQERPPQDTTAKLGYLGATRVVLVRYGKMLLTAHDFFSILAGICMWIVLAGFLVLPGSFPKMQNVVNDSHNLSKVVGFMQHIPL